MKIVSTLAAALTVTLILAGCDKKTDAPTVVSTFEGTPITSDIPAMTMPAGRKMGRGSGTVTAIANVAGKITLDHGAIPAVGWPAMKMGFSAKPAVLSGITVGDKVDVDVTVSGSVGEVTRIKKR